MPETRDDPPTGDDPGRAKREIRRRVLAARDALPATERDRLSAAVCARAAGLPELAAASTLLLFASFRSEVDTGPLVAWALEQGKHVCLPRVVGPQVMTACRVQSPAADLESGSWGIREPQQSLAEVAPEAMDAVIVPGSVFDAAGRRCGYGGGFYDTYLPRTRPGTPWVALAFEVQLVDELPCEPHDLAVTAIVTEKRVIRPG